MFCITMKVLWVLWRYRGTSIKNNNANLYKFWCLSAYKKWTSSLIFLRYCIKMQRGYLEYFWECLTMLINNDSLQLLFWDIVKILQTCYFGNFWNAWSSLSKVIVSICWKVLCLSSRKKINFITHFFLMILQQNSKLALLDNLGMPGNTHLKW